jgi:hypothetical protein
MEAKGNNPASIAKGEKDRERLRSQSSDKPYPPLKESGHKRCIHKRREEQGSR